MTDFQNHRRFLLRCPSGEIIPVSIKLKSNIRTPKSCSIIKRAERALLNERIRMVNNTITIFDIQIDTCMNHLKGILNKETMEECVKFIKVKRESRHIKTLERQKLKFNQLCHINTGGCSNHLHGDHGDHDQKQHEKGTITPVSRDTTQTMIGPDLQKAKWVINISSKPLTTAQESLLSHGPIFAVVLKGPFIVECVTAVEQIYQKLGQGEADELRAKVKTILKKAQPPDQIYQKKNTKP